MIPVVGGEQRVGAAWRQSAIAVGRRSGLAVVVLLTKPPSTMRILLLPSSATKTLPALSTATPTGLLNLAGGPVTAHGGGQATGPLFPPGRPAMPATTDKVPSIARLRICWFIVSAMKRLPSSSTAMPLGAKQQRRITDAELRRHTGDGGNYRALRY